MEGSGSHVESRNPVSIKDVLNDIISELEDIDYVNEKKECLLRPPKKKYTVNDNGEDVMLFTEEEVGKMSKPLKLA